MRNRSLQWVSAGMLTLTIVAPTFAQDVGGLHFVAAVTEYYGVEYVPPPARQAFAVVFTGESVQLRLAIGNRNPTVETLATSGRSMQDAFSLEVIDAPEGASKPLLLPASTGRITGDGGSDVAWGDDIGIPARGSVTFNGAIATSPAMVPGVYKIKITPNLQTSSKLNPLSTIVRYEVRVASTFADEVEVMRRQMMREYHRENQAAAEAACDALLEKYPRSAAAYRIKGLLAASRDDRKGAIEALGKAHQLLATGQDELWRSQPANKLQRALTDLTVHIDAAAKNATIRMH